MKLYLFYFTLLFSCVFAQVLYFNPKMESTCSEVPPSCLMNDTALWIPAETPNEATRLVVNSSTSIQVVLAPDLDLTLYSLNVTGNAIVIVEGYLSFNSNSTSTITLENNSTLQFSGKSVSSSYQIHQNDMSTLVFRDNTLFFNGEYYGSTQATILMYGSNLVLLGIVLASAPLKSIIVESGELSYTGSVTSLYVGETGNLRFGIVSVNEDAFIAGTVNGLFAGPGSFIVINQTLLVNHTTGQIINLLDMSTNSTVYWSVDSINVTGSIYMNPYSLLSIDATGTGPYIIPCGEQGTTVVDNVKGDDAPIELYCNGESTTGELILTGNYIMNANQYYVSTTKVTGSLIYIAQNLTFLPNSTIYAQNVSIVIPDGGVLSFYLLDIIFASFPWPIHWEANSSISIMDGGINFGEELIIQGNRQIIIQQVSQPSNITVDYLLVESDSRLWIYSGAHAKLIGSLECSGVLDLTTGNPNGTLGVLPTNFTVTGNLSLYNTSLTRQQIRFLPYAQGFIDVELTLFLAGTLDVTISGTGYKLPARGLDIPIMKAGSISGDFDSVIFSQQQFEYTYNISHSIRDNQVLLHLDNE